MNVSLETCDSSPTEVFTSVQFLFRAYLMPFTYLFGIVANTINIIVFAQKPMRSQSVNWFFLLLSVSDLIVLVSSFFVFSVPVYAEVSDDVDRIRLSAFLCVWFYPLAQTGLTMSVYLTILVSVHRYLGVCHPFLIRRISNSTAVQGVIVSAVLFAFLFNTSRWLELTVFPCYSIRHSRISLVVYPTILMINSFYTLFYRNIAYTLVMFFLPFAILSFVNLRIIGTLRTSYKLRRQMTTNQTKKTVTATPTEARISTSRSSIVVSTAKFMVRQASQSNSDRKENGVTIMLVAITTEFLLFNLLAFANNILELTGAYGHSQLETFLVEVSVLLVNINGASTIIIYLIFGSKYRIVFLRLFRSLICTLFGPRKRSRSASCPQLETSLLLDSRIREKRNNWKTQRSKSDCNGSETHLTRFSTPTNS